MISSICRAWPALVLALALAVRLWGIDWQLPYALYFDEQKYAERAGAAVRGQLPDRADFRNPSLFRHFLMLEYRILAVVQPSGDGQDDVRELSVVQLGLARITSAVLGALACLLTALAAATPGAHVLGRAGRVSGGPGNGPDDGAGAAPRPPLPLRRERRASHVRHGGQGCTGAPRRWSDRTAEISSWRASWPVWLSPRNTTSEWCWRCRWWRRCGRSWLRPSPPS